MSSTRKPARRFVRAIGVAHPNSRKPEDGPTSNRMTAEEQLRCAQNYKGSPMRIRHYDDSEDMDVGRVADAWVHDDSMYTMFDIDRDWKKPWAWQAGTYVLNGWFNGLSTNTTGLRNEKTGEIYSNCATDKPIDLSLCPLSMAKRGDECRILAKWEMQEYDDGSVEILRNIYDDEEHSIPEKISAAVSSTNHQPYIHPVAPATGESTNPSPQPVPFKQMASTTAATQPPTEAVPAPAAPSDAAAAAGAAAGSSEQRGQKRSTPDSAASAIAQTEQQLQKGMADLSKLSKSLAGDNAPGETAENAAALRGDLELLAQQVKLLRQERDEAIESARKEKLENERKKVKALVTDIMATLEEAMKEGGGDPSKNETLAALKNTDNAQSIEELQSLEKAALFAQSCAIPLKHRAMERDAALARASAAAQSAKDAEQAIAATSARMASFSTRVNSESQRSASSGIASRVPGFSWPSTNGGVPTQNQPLIDPAAVRAAAAADRAASSPANPQQQPNLNNNVAPTPMDTSAPAAASSSSAAAAAAAAPPRQANPNAACFELTPYGTYDLKMQFQPDRRLSTDKALPPTTETHLRRPTCAAAVYEHARPVEFGDRGMQLHNPSMFLNMLEQATSATMLGKNPIEMKEWKGRKFERPEGARELPDALVNNAFGYGT